LHTSLSNIITVEFNYRGKNTVT